MSTRKIAERKQTDISKAQAELLAAAANDPEGHLPAGGDKPRSGLSRTVQALLGRGLIRKLDGRPEQGTAAGEQGSSWQITGAGLRAIGAPDLLLGAGREKDEAEDASSTRTAAAVQGPPDGATKTSSKSRRGGRA